MLYDAFPFFDELDALEIRLHELNDVVDRFILAEGEEPTHAGSSFEENRDRFSRFLPKITRIAVRGAPAVTANRTTAADAAAADIYRDALLEGLRDCRGDDVVILSDAGEIPAATKVVEFKGSKGIKVFQQRSYSNYLNYLDVAQVTLGTRMMPYAEMCRPSQLRRVEGIHVTAGGWRFGNLGAPLDEINSTDASAPGPAPDSGSGRFRVVPIDRTFPQYVQKNQEKLARLIRSADSVSSSVRSVLFEPDFPLDHEKVWVDRVLILRCATDLQIEIEGVRGYLAVGDPQFLLHQAACLPAGATVVEIGSFMGLSAILMCTALMNARNWSTRIHCVDTWEGSVEHQELREIRNHTLFDVFLENIDRAGVAPMITPMRMRSAGAASRFAHESVDMVFVDGDHSLPACYADLELWYPKLKPGGLLFGHDCLPDSEVRQALVKFLNERKLSAQTYPYPPIGWMYEIRKPLAG